MSKSTVKKSQHERKRLRTARPPTIRASQSPDKKGPLDPEQLRKIHAYWRAANYLSVGQIYLCENPLLREPLKLEHVKQLLLGHWGTTPGQNFIYAHLNRVIKQHDLNMIYISGPGHGAPAVVGNVYLEGTYSEVYPNISQDEAGLQKLFQQFSFPGGISSHVSPQTPGSIHEGGELGYSISHAFGAAFDNPELVVACVVGDGEAETGPLATAWHSNKFLDPVSDGVVLPILHLNGYKISNPTVLARITHEELDQLLRGYGWTPFFVEGEEPEEMHQTMAATLDKVVEQIQKIQHDARFQGDTTRPRLADDRPQIAQQVRPRHDLHLRSRTRHPGGGGQHLPRGHVQRGLSEHRQHEGALGSCSDRTPSPAGSPAMSRRRRRGRSIRGELGYSISHTFGAAFHNPNLVVACVVGDGEAETVATAWHSNKLPTTRSPRRGAADPAPPRLQYLQPTVLHASHEELEHLLPLR